MKILLVDVQKLLTVNLYFNIELVVDVSCGCFCMIPYFDVPSFIAISLPALK